MASKRATPLTRPKKYARGPAFGVADLSSKWPKSVNEAIAAEQKASRGGIVLLAAQMERARRGTPFQTQSYSY